MLYRAVLHSYVGGSIAISYLRRQCFSTVSVGNCFFGRFFDGDLASRAINCDLLTSGDALDGSCHSDDCRNAILTSHNRAVGDGPTHFHHQPACRQEERRPARVGRGRNQNFTRGQISTGWVKDDPRLRCDPSWRCWRSSQHTRSLVSLVSGEGAGFGAV